MPIAEKLDLDGFLDKLVEFEKTYQQVMETPNSELSPADFFGRLWVKTLDTFDAFFLHLPIESYSIDNIMDIAKELILRSFEVNDAALEALISDDEAFHEKMLKLLESELEEEALDEGELNVDEQQDSKIITELTIASLVELVHKLDRRRQHSLECKVDEIKIKISNKTNYDDNTAFYTRNKESSQKHLATLSSAAQEYDKPEYYKTERLRLEKDLENLLENSKNREKQVNEEIKKATYKRTIRCAMSIAIFGISIALVSLSVTPVGTAAIIGAATKIFGTGITTNFADIIIIGGTITGIGLVRKCLKIVFKIISEYKNQLKIFESELSDISKTTATQKSSLETQIKDCDTKLMALDKNLSDQTHTRSRIESHDKNLEELSKKQEELNISQEELENLKEQFEHLCAEWERLEKFIAAISNMEQSIKATTDEHPINQGRVLIFSAFDNKSEKSAAEEAEVPEPETKKKYIVKYNAPGKRRGPEE